MLARGVGSEGWGRRGRVGGVGSEGWGRWGALRYTCDAMSPVLLCHPLPQPALKSIVTHRTWRRIEVLAQ